MPRVKAPTSAREQHPAQPAPCFQPAVGGQQDDGEQQKENNHQLAAVGHPVANESGNLMHHIIVVETKALPLERKIICGEGQQGDSPVPREIERLARE